MFDRTVWSERFPNRWRIEWCRWHSAGRTDARVYAPTAKADEFSEFVGLTHEDRVALIDAVLCAGENR